MRTLQKQALGMGMLATGCLLMTVIFLMTALPKETQAMPDEIMITDISVAQVRAFALTNSTGKLGLMPLPDGSIELVGAPAGEYSQQKLSALIYSFSHLAAVHTISQPESDDRYQLDVPQASVSLIMADGGTVRLSIGRESPIDGTRYLRREGEETLYLIAATDAQLALQSAADFRQLALFPSLTADNLPQLERITVSAGANGWTVARGTSAGLYTLEAPAQAGLAWETVFEKVIRPLSTLVPEKYVSDETNLKQYGLHEPAIVLTVTIAGTDYRCGFAPKDAQSWYAVNLDGGPVGELDSVLLDFLQQDYSFLLGDSLYSRNIVEVARISAHDGSDQWSVEVSGEGESLAGTAGDRAVDATELLDFYNKALTIPIADTLDAMPANAKSILTLTVTLRNGTMDILEFLPVSDRQCAVLVNGKVQFTTYTTIVRDLNERFSVFTRRNSEATGEGVV